MDSKRHSSSEKIYIVYFGALSRHPDKKHLWFGNEIVEKIYSENALEKVYCLEAQGLRVDSSKVKPFIGSFYAKLAHGIAILLSYVLPSWSRKVTEYFFGLFVTQSIDYTKANSLLFLRATNKNLSLRAKKKGKNVVGMISIFPRCLVDSHIKQQEKKWDIVEQSDYTNRSRIKEFDEILSSWDTIIPWTNTQIVKQQLEKIPFVSKVKYTKHEYGVNREIFFFHEMPPLNRLKFLAVVDGTLKKGTLELLETWQRFNKISNTDAQLVIVGRVGEHILQALDRVSSRRNVHFAGYVKDVHNYMAESHVFVCPSIIDMGPRTIKQAMSIGRVVISSDRCGHAGCIEPLKEGLIYDPSNLDTLLNSLIWVETNYEKLPNMGRAASKKAESFDDNKFAEDIYDIVFGTRTVV